MTVVSSVLFLMMMTNEVLHQCSVIGNQFLVRGVEDGKRFEIRDSEFCPTLFVKSKEKQSTKR